MVCLLWPRQKWWSFLFGDVVIKSLLSYMISIDQYSEMIGVKASAVRKRICLAKKQKQDILEVLPGVVSVTKFGNSWGFVVDKKKLAKSVK